MTTSADPPGGPLTSGAISTHPNSFDSPLLCVDGDCPGSTTPAWGIDITSSDPLERASSTTESDAAMSPSKATQRLSTTIVRISSSSYSTSSQPTTLVVTVEASPTAAAALQTDGAGSEYGSSGINAGAVVGIAIATLIAGAVIAFVAAFFLFKRRNRTREANVANKDDNSYAESTPNFLIMQQQKNIGMGGRNSPYVQVSQTPTSAPAIVPTPLPASAQQAEGGDVAAFLPRVAPEGQVYNRVMALFQQCHSLIETYYRDVHASITASMEPDLAQFGAKDVNMAELLQDGSSPPTALKHALVAYVLGITAPRSDDDDETIFPHELSGLYSRADHRGSVDQNVTAAGILHRRLSVYLFNAAPPATLSRRALLTESNAHEAAEHFSLTFFPWANPAASDGDRDEALAGLVHMALRLRIWLYGEAFRYEFEWEETGRGGILVSPRLVRRSDGADAKDQKVVVEGVVMAA